MTTKTYRKLNSGEKFVTGDAVSYRVYDNENKSLVTVEGVFFAAATANDKHSYALLLHSGNASEPIFLIKSFSELRKVETVEENIEEEPDGYMHSMYSGNKE